MSLSDLKAFGRKCGEDPKLQKKAIDIGVSNLEGIIKLGRENGFNFSADDLTLLAKEVAQRNRDALDEKQLEAIAGGVSAGHATGLSVQALALAVSVSAAQASAGNGKAW